MTTKTQKSTSSDGIITQFLIYDPEIGKIEVIHYVVDNKQNKYYKLIRYTHNKNSAPPKSTYVYDIDNDSEEIYHSYVLGGIPHVVEAYIGEGESSKVTDLAGID
jgi:hypothetical protein